MSACPNDTNGDGDCGQIACPHCGPYAARMKEMAMPSKTEGLIHKYDVRRVDGTDQPGGKHEECRLFVLDIDHDPNARRALMVYAREVRRDGSFDLADDLDRLLAGFPEKPRG